jgi:surface polysaccharide O-acyltransferase-like enzyme
MYYKKITMKNKRLHYIDVLNCIAIIFVLLLHSAQLAHFGNSKYANFMLTEIMQCLFIPAVYIFFMNSGATLLDYREKYSTQTFYKKRIKRVLVPFLFWSFFYYFFNSHFHSFPGPTFNNNLGIRNFIFEFLNNDINNLFWFFYSIIALYVITPVFSVLIRDHKKVLSWVVILYFVFTDLLEYLSKLLSINFLTKFIDQPLISSSFLGYFLIGYLIKENYISVRNENLLILGGLFCLLLNIINILTSMKYSFLNNIGPFLYSVSIYLIIKRIVTNKQRDYKISRWLAGSSLGIYILHPIFYAFFDKIFFKAGSGDWNKYLTVLNNPIHILLMPFVVYFIIAIPLHYLKKFNLVRILIP